MNIPPVQLPEFLKSDWYAENYDDDGFIVNKNFDKWDSKIEIEIQEDMVDIFKDNEYYLFEYGKRKLVGYKKLDGIYTLFPTVSYDLLYSFEYYWDSMEGPILGRPDKIYKLINYQHCFNSDWEEVNPLALGYIKNKPFGISYDKKEQLEIKNNALIFDSKYNQYLVNDSHYCNLKIYEWNPNTFNYYLEDENGNILYEDNSETEVINATYPLNRYYGLINFQNKKVPTAQIQSDWNQTNKNALDYIKNKPFGIEANGITEIAVFTSVPSEYRYEDLYFKCIVENDIIYCRSVITTPYIAQDPIFELINIETGEMIYKYNYGTSSGTWYITKPTQMFKINSLIQKTLSWSYLPMDQFQANEFNPQNLTIEVPEITAQDAYDYAVSAYEQLKQFATAYNNLVNELRNSGYIKE